MLLLLLLSPSELLSVLFFSFSLPTADQRKIKQGKKSKWPQFSPFSVSLTDCLGLGLLASSLRGLGSDGGGHLSLRVGFMGTRDGSSGVEQVLG